MCLILIFFCWSIYCNHVTQNLFKFSGMLHFQETEVVRLIYLFHVFGDGVSASQGPDQGPGRDHWPLDWWGHLEGDVSEGLGVIHVLGKAGQVDGFERVLRVHNLKEQG